MKIVDMVSFLVLSDDEIMRRILHSAIVSDEITI